MNKIFTLLCIVVYSTASAQTMGTDSKGKSIYEFQKSQTFNLPVSSADNSVKLNFSWKIGQGTQYFGRHSTNADENNRLSDKSIKNDITFDKIKKEYSPLDSTKLTMGKSWGISGSLKVSNLLSNLAKISTFHPKYSASIGFGRNIDVFNNWENIRVLKYPFNNWNISFGIERDRVKIYDTTLHKVSDSSVKWTKTITANGSLYFPWTAPKVLIGVSGVVTYEIGNNIGDLKKYQDNKSLFIDNNITTLADFVGRIGDYKEQNSFRAAFSVNIFPGALKFKNETVQLCISPYTSFFGPVDSHLTKLLGLYVNASQGAGLFEKNSIIKSGIGVGVDWVVAPNGIGDISVFVGGSLDIHSFFPHAKKSGQ